MRVAYLLTTFPSVTENFALREIKAMQRLGMNIDVLAARKDLRIDNDFDAAVHYRPTRMSLASFFSITKLAVLRPLRFMKMLKLALRLMFISPAEFISLLANIHTVCDFTLYLEANNIRHLHAFFLSWPSLIAISVKLMSSINISISAHSRDIYVEAGDIVRKLQDAEFVAVCTQKGVDYIKVQVSRSLHQKLSLLYHGLDLADLRFHTSRASGFEIVAVGRLAPKKGFFVLLEAIRKICEVYPDIKLKIIGDGQLHTQISLYLKQNHLEDNVLLMGWQDHDSTIDAIDRSSLLVVPSIKADDGDMDGIPNVILEAFFLKTPVIASDIESICEAIGHKVNGLLFKAEDSNDLAEKIIELHQSDSLRERIVLNARRTLVRDFDIEKNVINKMKLFEQE